MHTPDTLHAALTDLAIPHTIHRHKVLHTVADGEEVYPTMPGAHIKNLFVKDKKDNLFLITALNDRLLNLVTLGKHLGSKDRFSFGNEDLLYATLGVRPGSVTPLGLINAKPGSLRFILDEGILSATMVYAHPLQNDQSTGLAPADLMKAIHAWGHTPEVLDLGLFPRA